jgi:phosphatidylglycerophosphatase A
MSSTEEDKVALQGKALRKVALGSPSGLLAFGFGSGLSPFAPGTMGTLVAIPFIFVLKSLGTVGFWVALCLLFFFRGPDMRPCEPQTGCARSRWYCLG